MFAGLEVEAAAYEGLFKEVRGLVNMTKFTEKGQTGLMSVLQVKYYVTGTLEEKVQQVLEGGGAKKTAYLSGINTHCIVGTDPDYNEVSEAVDMLDVPSVEQDWVIASTHCRKLLPLKVTTHCSTMPQDSHGNLLICTCS